MIKVPDNAKEEKSWMFSDVRSWLRFRYSFFCLLSHFCTGFLCVFMSNVATRSKIVKKGEISQLSLEVCLGGWTNFYLNKVNTTIFKLLFGGKNNLVFLGLTLFKNPSLKFLFARAALCQRFCYSHCTLDINGFEMDQKKDQMFSNKTFVLRLAIPKTYQTKLVHVSIIYLYKISQKAQKRPVSFI